MSEFQISQLRDRIEEYRLQKESAERALEYASDDRKNNIRRTIQSYEWQIQQLKDKITTMNMRGYGGRRRTRRRRTRRR